ncbi:MAG TPA: HlyC/CorC family transporter [Armatimonadetes bacterium]|nr:HlyC/CorC family transporter [Armatimonadota bacterium]
MDEQACGERQPKRRAWRAGWLVGGLVLGLALAGVLTGWGAEEVQPVAATEVGLERPLAGSEEVRGEETGEHPWTGGVLIILVLLATQAFLAAAEVSFLSLGRVKARQLAETEGPRGRVLVRLLERPRVMLATVLISITSLLYFADEQATLLATRIWGDTPRVQLLVPVVMALVAIPFVDLLPILYARQHAERHALRAARPVTLLVWLLTPVVRPVTFLMRRFIGEHQELSLLVTEVEIRDAILRGRRQGVLSPEQSEMLARSLEFVDKVVKEVMTPRPDVTFLQVDMTVAEALEVINQDVHSRFPVYRESRDDIIGVIHAKNLLPYVGREQEQTTRLSQVLEHLGFPPALHVPETTGLSEVLQEMRRHQVSLAMVIDEYGGVEGIVTIEDILEELVGSILDEEDVAEPELRPVPGEEGTYLCSGRYSIDELQRDLKVTFPKGDYDTLAGFLLARVGQLPEEGTEVTYGDLRFTVERVNGERKRIESVRIQRQSPPPASEEEEREGGEDVL